MAERVARRLSRSEAVIGAETPLYRGIADPESLETFRPAVEPGNPSGWPGSADDLERARKATGTRLAVTTGFATIGGERCVLVGFEFAFFDGSIGTAEGAMITRAFAAAIGERLPVVCVAASGGARMQEGTSALVQMQAVAAAIAAARREGIPFAAVAGDPTTGGVWSSLVAAADVVMAVGTAIAELLVAVRSCTVPITSVVMGDGVSGGAIALCSPGDSWISPDGYLSVAAPELATSILKRDSADAAAIADLLRLTPADLTARGIVRGVVTPQKGPGS